MDVVLVLWSRASAGSEGVDAEIRTAVRLKKKVLPVLLKEPADWRWMDDRTDSPWYPTMRLFRQKTAGDWETVCEEVAAALRTLRTKMEHARQKLLNRDLPPPANTTVC